MSTENSNDGNNNKEAIEKHTSTFVCGCEDNPDKKGNCIARWSPDIMATITNLSGIDFNRGSHCPICILFHLKKGRFQGKQEAIAYVIAQARKDPRPEIAEYLL